MLNVSINKYTIIENFHDVINDTLAKQDLTQHAYNKYYVKS